jgi:hypothetical protein
MATAWNRPAVLALTALAVTGCTFGMLKRDDCLKTYGPGMMYAASQARLAQSVVEESYGFCTDGRAKAQAMLAPLRAHAFETGGPSKHFEVPGGWCLSAKRATTPQRFNPIESLETVCAIGHASRAYLTGGKLSTAAGGAYYVRSTYEREAEDALQKRLVK